jgi:hypothetical protein
MSTASDIQILGVSLAPASPSQLNSLSTVRGVLLLSIVLEPQTHRRLQICWPEVRHVRFAIA